VTRRVLCVDGDAGRRLALCEAAREVGAEPVEPPDGDGRAALELARDAQVVIGGGDEGVELLARLALDRPLLPRIAVLDGVPGLAETLSLIDRVHPWALVTDLGERARLHALLRDALASAEPAAATDQMRRAPAPDFAQLTIDRLTGADSYHYLLLRLEEELARAARYRRPLSLALVDVDELGGINDRYGRAAGDFALSQVAGTLQSGARAVDRVGRCAGGLFALVLPETVAGAAYGLAERLRADLSARRFSTTLTGGRAVERLRVTVSCGVACTVQDGVSRAATLWARADGALWRAKQGGRNRSVVDG
jgi:diguanylate cyclase (GGDEF)-like protein